jgi:hypothetical protein
MQTALLRGTSLSGPAPPKTPVANGHIRSTFVLGQSWALLEIALRSRTSWALLHLRGKIDERLAHRAGYRATRNHEPRLRDDLDGLIDAVEEESAGFSSDWHSTGQPEGFSIDSKGRSDTLQLSLEAADAWTPREPTEPTANQGEGKSRWTWFSRKKPMSDLV